MMFDLPDDDTLYAAMLIRDQSYDGRAFVCVRTTGIFCRLDCPARNPKRENCTFEETPGACIAAGYRPCKRCHPLASAALAEPHVAALLKALEDRPTYRWSEADVQRMGFDPSTVRRAFRRHFGMTFLDMARQTRLRNGFTAMEDGARVIDAQVDAGFASASAFRTAFGKLMGVPPATFTDGGLLRVSWIETPLGAMLAISDARALHLLEFMDRKALPGELRKLTKAAKGAISFGRFAPMDQIARELEAFFAGRDATFTVPLAMNTTPFTQQVWEALQTIPAGETRTYGAVAQYIGRPTATRAVARANGANQIAIVIPCHRVIGQDGTLTGYGGGLWRKQRLIEIEQSYNR